MACNYTQEQLDALTQAIATGALEVYYGDKKVRYRSLDEMLRLQQKMQDCLNGKGSATVRVFANFNKGLN